MATSYAYLKLTMVNSGDINGTTEIKGLEKWLEVGEIEIKCETPTDRLSGLQRGQRNWFPLQCIVQANNPGIPLLFQALTRNEKIKAAELRLYQPNNQTGKNECHTTIKLTEGGLAHAQLKLPNVWAGVDDKNAAAMGTIPAFVHFSMTFGTIQIDNNPAKTTVTDDWKERNIS